MSKIDTTLAREIARRLQQGIVHPSMEAGIARAIEVIEATCAHAEKVEHWHRYGGVYVSKEAADAEKLRLSKPKTDKLF
jgi:hypothetical protein